MSYKFRQVQTCLKIKQILDKSKLVLNNLDNSRQTKLDMSKLVWNNPVHSYLQYTHFTSWWNTIQVYTCLDYPLLAFPTIFFTFFYFFHSFFTFWICFDLSLFIMMQFDTIVSFLVRHDVICLKLGKCHRLCLTKVTK